MLYTDASSWMIKLNVLSDHARETSLIDTVYGLCNDFALNLRRQSLRSDIPEKYRNMIQRELNYDQFMRSLEDFRTNPGIPTFRWNIFEDIRHEIKYNTTETKPVRDTEKLLAEMPRKRMQPSLFDEYKSTEEFGRLINTLKELMNCSKPNVSDIPWPKGISYTERGAKVEYEIHRFESTWKKLSTKTDDLAQNLCKEAYEFTQSERDFFLHEIWVDIPSVCVEDEHMLEHRWMTMLTDCLSHYACCTGILNKDHINSRYACPVVDLDCKKRDMYTQILLRAFPPKIVRSAWATLATGSQIEEIILNGIDLDKTPFYRFEQFANGNAILVKTRHADYAKRSELNAIAEFIYPYTTRYFFGSSRLRQIPSLRCNIGLGNIALSIDRPDGSVCYDLFIKDIIF